MSVEIGCCGWSYDDWVGPFYPEGTRPGDYLALYAQRFSIVEVDSTFYGTPSRRMVEGWHERTPPGFRFSLKVPQVITHEKVLQNCDEELDGFLAAARLLGEKLHSVCLQFGYFNKGAFPSLTSFLKQLDPFLRRWPADVPVAVEIRNRAWLEAPFADCLRAHNAAMVLTVQGWMPQPAQVMERMDAVTGPFAYVRLLGDRKAIEKLTTTWNRTVLDKSDELRTTVAAIRQLAIRAPVLVFVNNHYAGHGPDTADTVTRFLTE